jgi:two-component system, OmpR family, phosphate regulon sensor histidine kinase PhoR
MKAPKNFVTVTLMASSILLLLVLQLFWLRGAYLNAAEDFQKETNILFRNTIFAMHDTLIQRNLEPVQGDSMMRSIGIKRFRFNDRDPFEEGPFSDSNIHYLNMPERTARIEIFTTNDSRDSIKRILRPLADKIQHAGEPKSFILRLGPDSLKVDSINFYYRLALEGAGIQATFKVITLRYERGAKIEKKIAQPKGTFTSEIVRLNPVSRYAVSFTGINGLLLKEITPQILFSVFLTLLTIVSFYVMYRNLRSQQKLMEIKNDFISNITHELKTPVATVSVALEALKNFHALDNPKRTSEYLEIAQNELNRLTLMTDKILRTAVFEDQGIDLKTEKIDLDVIVSQVLSSMKLVLENRKMQLRYTKEGADFTVEGNVTHMTNVLYNLIDNALKYSGDNSSLNIHLQDGGDKIVMKVADTGAGIAPEYHRKVFEKFFRVPSGDIHTIKGYGLGLSYVAGVVKNLKGEITVDSELGKGSCFEITLPKHQDSV